MSSLVNAPCEEGVIRSAPDTEPCASDVGRWVLVATILGSSMAFINASVVNVALPALQRELQATVVDVQWVVNAYMLLLAALILLGGSLGDHYGRRLIFGIGVAVFTAAAVACGLAQTVDQLIAFRAVQGVGGALLTPGSLAIISATFSDDQRGRAIGLWAGFSAITSAIGPVLGGWLIENLSWRWIFFLNVPMAAVILLVLWWRVPESHDEEAGGRLDWWGGLLATLGLGGVTYGLIEAGGRGLSDPGVLVALAVGVVSLAVFFLVEARIAEPIMPLGLFRSRTFSGANLLTLLLYTALSGALFFLPLNLIQVQGYSATAAGAALLPMIALMSVLGRWSGDLVDRYGAKRPLVIGPLIAAVGFSLFLLPGIGGSYWTTFFPAVAVLGLGMAISVAPLTTAVMGAVPAHRSGIASGINNAIARAAALFAVAIFGLVVLMVFTTALDQRMAELDLPQEAVQALEQERTNVAAAAVPEDLPDETEAALERAIAESFVAGFRVVMGIAAGLALLSAVSAWLLIEGKPHPARQQQRPVDADTLPAKA